MLKEVENFLMSLEDALPVFLILFSSSITLDRKGCYQNNLQIVFFFHGIIFMHKLTEKNFCNKQPHSINETPPYYTARMVFWANNLYTFPTIYIGCLNEMFQPHLISSQSFKRKCLIFV